MATETATTTPTTPLPEDVPTQALTKATRAVEDGTPTDVQVTYTTNADGKRIKKIIRKRFLKNYKTS